MARARQCIEPKHLIAQLGDYYGLLAGAPTTDPFELILWENVVYLAPPARRREAFDQLRETVGTTPRQILQAKRSALEKITAKGILKGTFAEKLRECARIVTDEFDGDLRATLRAPLAQAKRALRRFPGIGEPGAEKILLFAGALPLLAPDSNALRVLTRVGVVADDASYSRLYAAGREVQKRLRAEMSAMQQAHLLLQHHGQQLCKRSVPLCGKCPLTRACPKVGVASPKT